jgi:tight adherence protein C
MQLEETLLASGFRAGNALGLFVGTKVLLLVSVPALAAVVLPGLGLSGLPYTVAIAGAGCIGLLAPDYTINKIRQKHLAQVEHGLPDALDMMVICTEAGLGLEPSLSRVSVEILHVHPALAKELDRTSSELQMLSDSRIALLNMGTRTGLESLRRLGTTLVQTMQYGTPLSAALRVLSTELRLETLTRFEERAARLPVLLTMPMILFILPCVFLVVGGPAIIQVMAVMR